MSFIHHVVVMTFGTPCLFSVERKALVSIKDFSYYKSSSPCFLLASTELEPLARESHKDVSAHGATPTGNFFT